MPAAPVGSGPLITFTSSGRFFHVGNGPITTAITTESIVQVPCRTTGAYSLPSIQVTTNTVTAGVTVQFRKNGANGNQAIAITGNITGEFMDSSGTDSVASGDLVNWQINWTGAGSVTLGSLKQLFDTQTGNTVQRFLVGSAGTAFSTASVTDYQRVSAPVNLGVTAVNVEMQAQAAVTVNNLFVNITANTSTNAVTIGTVKNGASGSLSISSTGSGTFEDTTHSDSLAQGDLWCFRITTGTSTVAVTISTISVELSSITGFFHLLSQFSSQPVGANNNAFCPFGYHGTSGYATESSAQETLGVQTTASRMWIYSNINTRSDITTLTLRRNSAAMALIISIAALTTGNFSDTTHIVSSLGVSDEMDINLVTLSGTGSITLQTLDILGHTPVIVVPSSIDTSSAFPSSGISIGVTADAITTTAIFGFQVVQKLQPVALSTTGAFPAPKIIQKLQPSALVTTTTFGFQLVQKLQPVALFTTASLPAFVISQKPQPGPLATVTSLPAPSINQVLQPSTLATTTALLSPGVVQRIQPVSLGTVTQIPSVTIVQMLHPSSVNTVLSVIGPGIGQSALPITPVLGMSAGFPSLTLTTKISLQASALITTAAYPASSFGVGQTVFPSSIATVYAQMGIGLTLGKGLVITPMSLALSAVFPLPFVISGSVVRPAVVSTALTLSSSPTIITGQGVLLSLSSVGTSVGLPVFSLITSQVLRPASLSTVTVFPVNAVIAGVGASIFAVSIVSLAGIPAEQGEGGARIVFPRVFPVETTSQINQPSMTTGVLFSPQSIASVSNFPPDNVPRQLVPASQGPPGSAPVTPPGDMGAMSGVGLTMQSKAPVGMVEADRLVP